MIKGLGQEDLYEVETMKTVKYKKEDAFSNHPIKDLAATLDDYSRIDNGATGGNTIIRELFVVLLQAETERHAANTAWQMANISLPTSNIHEVAANGHHMAPYNQRLRSRRVGQH
ncbi:unnamed protein product [Clonostachys rhizophaga]|uniref:Uncharacterized protein n=1 Tax=Clonostachys rhizophaga TaxID=160324 RepID=A0A9N9YQH0_9HYPO|nr:unnamed protein product [Clonostachys rhizophaga]